VSVFLAKILLRKFSPAKTLLCKFYMQFLQMLPAPTLQEGNIFRLCSWLLSALQRAELVGLSVLLSVLDLRLHALSDDLPPDFESLCGNYVSNWLHPG
jgi:hypothetical protein